MSTTGLPLNLVKHVSGFKGWAADMNANLDSINAAIAALQAGGGAVSSVFGRTGVVVAAANDYSFSQLSGIAGLAQGGTNADLSGLGSGCLIYNNAGVLAGDASLEWGNTPLVSSTSGVISEKVLGLEGSATQVTSIQLVNYYEAGISMFCFAGSPVHLGRGPCIYMGAAGGSEASPLAAQQGQNFGTVLTQGWDGTNWYRFGGQWEFCADENWDTTHHGTNFQLWLCAHAGSALSFEGGLLPLNSANGNRGFYLAGSGSAFYACSGGGFYWLSASSISPGFGAAVSPDTGISRTAAAALAIGNGTQGDFSGTLKLGKTILSAAAPTVAAAQVGFGSTTGTSATAGSNGAVPAQVAGYLIINVGGTAMKVPYFAS